MSFKLGLDIGLVMAKGVLLGVITVVTFLPALILCLTIKSKRQGIRAWFLISASLMNSPLSIAV